LKIAVRSLSGVKSDGSDWTSAADFAREAEMMGVDSIWTSEAWGADAISPLAFLAGQTSSIRLGTGIIQVGSRSPANLVMTSLTMQSISEGRFILGLGTSGPQVMEGWHGVPFRGAVSRTKELIEIIRKGISGETLDYVGNHYSLPLAGGEGKVMRSSALPEEVPIFVAALGPANLEMAGELADGWLGGCFIPETADVFLDKIRVGLGKSGRTTEEFELVVPLSLELTEEIEEAGKRHARGYGFTFGAMGSIKNNFYKNAYSRQGYGEVLDVVQRLWKDGRREEARELVPVDLALKSNLIGTEDMVKERLGLYEDVGITSLKVDIPGEGVKEKVEELGKFMDIVKDLEDH